MSFTSTSVTMSTAPATAFVSPTQRSPRKKRWDGIRSLGGTVTNGTAGTTTTTTTNSALPVAPLSPVAKLREDYHYQQDLVEQYTATANNASTQSQSQSQSQYAPQKVSKRKLGFIPRRNSLGNSGFNEAAVAATYTPSLNVKATPTSYPVTTATVVILTADCYACPTNPKSERSNSNSNNRSNHHGKTSRRSSTGTSTNTNNTSNSLPLSAQFQQQRRRGSNQGQGSTQARSVTPSNQTHTQTYTHTIQNMNMNRKAAPVDTETLAADRHMNGQCHSCGQQLFTVSTCIGVSQSSEQQDAVDSTNTVEGNEATRTRSKRGLRGLFSKHPKAPTTGGTAAATATTEVSRVPVTVPGKVHRGHCLVCTERPNVSQNVEQERPYEQEQEHTHPAETTDHGNSSKATGRHLYSRKPAPGSVAVSVQQGSTDDNGMHNSSRSTTPIYTDTNNSSTIPNNNNNNNSTSASSNASTSTATSTATYSGPFNDYGERHGPDGVMTWSNGDVYKGQFVHGHRHGHGVLNFSDGSEYVGQWAANIMDGAGTRRFPNGDVYMGDYIQGKRTGQGRFYFSNGDMYVGTWESDCMMGFGRYYYSSGQRFEGNFFSGKRHGKGKLQRVDGELDIYRYEYDVRSVQGVRWSPDRTKAWLLQSGKVKSKLSVIDAVSLVYELENVLQPSVSYAPHAASTNGVQA